VCVDCHIGSQGPDGLPSRNMNHDMIAAGHPRLIFEYSAFLANMPKHWDDKATAVDGPPAKIWAMGQNVSMQAALELLAARAKDAQANPKAPWPELAEYDCYTCHHAITPDGYHRTAMKPANDSGHKPGQYVWGRWYLPIARTLFSEGLLMRTEESKAPLAKFDELERAMAQPAPLPADIAAKAKNAAEFVEQYKQYIERDPFSPDTTARLLTATTAHGYPTNWDEACGIYLLYRTLYWNEERLRPLLSDVRKTLQFTTEPAQSPRETSIRLNSPKNFKPQDFAQAMDALKKQLPAAGH